VGWRGRDRKKEGRRRVGRDREKEKDSKVRG